MCGIAGYVTVDPPDQSVLRAMLDAQFHRGPDDQGLHLAPPFHGGMQRLSINDVEGGGQPLYNADQSVVLIYNGEIYNSPDLRRRYEARGIVFRTHSDGEVIPYLYDEFGEAAFEHLDGMFACAMWDSRKRKLLLARDHAGEKPLYVARLPDGGAAFSSDLNALRRYPGLDLSLNMQALWDFPTFLWIPEPATVFQGVEALPRGCFMSVEPGKPIRIERFANRFDPGPPPGAGPAEVAAHVRAVVEKAVSDRLLSDVKVGAFLSSGLDSSIVATIAARSLSNLTTFSVAFEDLDDPFHGSADESGPAAEYARRIGSEHIVLRADESTFLDGLDAMARLSGQPFAVSSGLGIFAVARAAREQGVKVLLSGDGADECFGGYSWYAQLARTASADTAAPPREAFSWANVEASENDRLSVLAGYPPPRRAWAWHYFAAESEKAAIFEPEAFDGVKTSHRLFAEYKPDDIWAPEDFVRQDRGFYLPNEMMRKLDLMTMACSVEGRAPFVAPAVLGLAEHLRYTDMVADGTLKAALRRAFADLLPPEVVSRPKHGFNVPLDHWFRGRWRRMLEEATAPSSALARRGFLRPGAREAVLRMADDRGRISGNPLMAIMMLNKWLEGEDRGDHC